MKSDEDIPATIREYLDGLRLNKILIDRKERKARIDNWNCPGFMDSKLSCKFELIDLVRGFISE
jgi:hypothetical protein